MPAEKEEVIIEFKIDQGAAFRDLEKLEKVIIDNRNAQKELNDALKKGNVTQEEYIQENLRLQQNLKKEQDQKRTLTQLINTESNSRNALKIRVAALTKEYDNLNLKTADGIKRQKELEKELTTLNNQITKTSKSAGLFKDQIGNYPDKFKEAASSINVAGVSVGDIGTKLAAFANPATAAIGIVGALGAAYARSTIGAKDLEFAQNQLSFATTLVTNSFAELISSAKDGEGLFSKITNLVVGSLFGPELAVKSKLLAGTIEDLEDLQREEIGIRDNINDRLETNQELLTEINAEQTSFNDKIFSADRIVDNLRKNEEELTEVKKKELEIVQFQLRLNKDSEAIQTAVLEKQREISNIERDTEKRVQAILRLKDNINQAENKRLAILREEARVQADIDRRAGKIVSPGGSGDIAKNKQVEQDIKTAFLVNESDIELQIRKDTYNKLRQYDEEYEKNRTEIHKKEIEIRHQADLTEVQLAAGVLGSLASLFKQGGEEYRLIASAQTIISTYAGAVKAYESQASIPYVGPELGAAAAAAAIVEGLANLAVINGVQFAEGGFTGSGGKYEPAGVVHKGEYVVPQSVNYSSAAQPHIAALESMRLTGYATGGLVAGQMTQGVNSEVAQMNAVKNLPNPEVSVYEITKVQSRIKVKENISTL